MTLPRTPIPPEKMSTLGATGNWIQPGEQTTAQTSQHTSGEDPISKPLPPPPQMAQQLEEQETLQLLQAKAKEEGTDKEEHTFVEFVEFIIDNVSEMVDKALWEKKAQELLQLLENHFTTSLKFYFDHLDQADKFYMRREGWIKKLLKLKEARIQGNVCAIKGTPLDQLMLKQPATWCHHLVLQLRHPMSTNTKNIEDHSSKKKDTSIQKSITPVFEDPSSNEDSDSDDDSENLGETFEERFKQEPSHGRFINVSYSLGGMRKKFNQIIRSIRSHLSTQSW